MPKNIKWNGRLVEDKMLDRVEKALNRSGALLERKIKLSMRAGTGKVYIKKSVRHRASAPGQPPAVDLGRLRSSITWRSSMLDGSVVGADAKPEDAVGFPVSTVPGEIIVIVGTNVEYAADLELGTPKIKPRPFLRPALENNRAEILKFFSLVGRFG